MLKKKTIACLLGSALCGTLWADTFVLNKAPSSLADWKDGSFYVEGTAPTGAASDVVATLTSANLTIDLDGTNDNGENNAMFKFLGGIRGVILSNAVLRVNVPAGSVAQFDCAVWDSSMRTGKIEKYGEGELYLASDRKLSTTSTSVADFETHLHVFEGTLRLTRNAVESNKYHMFHSITIEKPAKLITLFNNCVWQVRGLYGEGMITNEASSLSSLYVCERDTTSHDGGDFKGVIGGNIAVQARGCKFSLSGTKNTFTGGLSGTVIENRSAELHVADFGEVARGYSSMGPGNTALTLSEQPFVYEGTGQITDRKIQLNYLNSVLDAGKTGNLIIKGVIDRWSTTMRNPSLFLVGDNANPCTFMPSGVDGNNAFGEFQRTADSIVERYNHYFGKRGTGEWHFPLTGKFANTGVFAVENGTLSYASIDRAGELTALGYSTRLFANKNILHPSIEPQVQYAFLLGSDVEGEVGLMSCTSKSARQCTDRPFGLKGKGGFLADHGLVKYAKVFGVGDGARTLVLTGSNEYENEIHDVADRLEGASDAAVVSVEKNGSGTWVLGGDQTFSGSLTVNGGTLIVRRPEQKYSRYRLMVMSVVYKDTEFDGSPTSTQTDVHIAEIGLYADDNTRQNLNLKYNSSYAALQPGECALGLNRQISNMASGPYNVYELMFDGYRKRFNDEDQKSASWHGISGQTFSYEGTEIVAKTPTFDQPSTYLPIDMYLASDAKPIDHFDVMSSARDSKRIPSRVQLLASVDGIHWDEVSTVEKIAGVKDSNNYWLSDLNTYGGSFVDGGSPSKVITSQSNTSGWKTTKTVPTREFSMLENVSSVTVANGATLKYEGAAEGAPTLSHVSLAANASGSINGFKFAEEGVLELNEVVGRQCEVGVTLPNSSGLENVANWQVSVAGVMKPNYRVRAASSGFVVDKSGLMVIVR